MNTPALLPCITRRLVHLAAWAMSACLVATASAQVKPPEAKDTDGNEYRYPVHSFMTIVSSPPGPHVAATWQKSAAIIIPRLNFHDTPLTDAIEFIRQESRRLDPDPDPTSRGLNIFLKLPAATTTSPAHVTAELTNVPVMEALKSVAEQAGLKVKAEQYAVSLVPLSENTESMFTAEYRVPPAAIGLPSEPVPTPSTDKDKPMARHDPRPWLESKGITFPPGASAIYLIEIHKLIVRETQENLNRIADLLDPSPKNP